MRSIRTIGYEGADIEDFLATLESAKVSLVLDIREIPVSRRKGFSKNILASLLEDVGIGYRHEKALGSPKALRDRLRETGNFEAFFRDYDRYLEKQSTLLEELADSLKGTVVLLCYERNPAQCHRKSVARMLGDLADLTPKHLGVQPNGS